MIALIVCGMSWNSSSNKKICSAKTIRCNINHHEDPEPSNSPSGPASLATQDLYCPLSHRVISLPCEISTALDTTAMTLSVSSYLERGVQPPSPHPPSSSSSDSSEDESNLLHSPSGLRTTVASVPEDTLRSIVVKLASSNPRFHRAILKELAYAQAFGDSPPTTPISPKPRRRHRIRHQTQRKRKSLSVPEDTAPFTNRERQITKARCPQEILYHPGHLDEEVYEFLSRTPQESTFKVLRTISMWTCCDEDEWNPGCVSVPHYADDEMGEGSIMELSHSVAFPDSDLERGYEDILRNTIARSSAPTYESE